MTTVPCAKCGCPACSVDASGFCNICRDFKNHPNKARIDAHMRAISYHLDQLRDANHDSMLECSISFPLRESVIDVIDYAWGKYCEMDK